MHPGYGFLSENTVFAAKLVGTCIINTVKIITCVKLIKNENWKQGKNGNHFEIQVPVPYFLKIKIV